MGMGGVGQAAAAHEYAADRIVDASGCILAPGLIDLQLNGGFGYDFSSPADCIPENVRSRFQEMLAATAQVVLSCHLSCASNHLVPRGVLAS